MGLSPDIMICTRLIAGICSLKSAFHDTESETSSFSNALRTSRPQLPVGKTRQGLPSDNERGRINL
jgi:hypothetical protein